MSSGSGVLFAAGELRSSVWRFHSHLRENGEENGRTRDVDVALCTSRGRRTPQEDGMTGNLPHHLMRQAQERRILLECCGVDGIVDRRLSFRLSRSQPAQYRR